MDIFKLTLNQMLVMFSFMLAGFILRKRKILPESSDVTMSRLETYILVPALNIANQLKNCNVKTFTENSMLILYGLGITVFAMAMSYPLSRLFIKDKNEDYKRSIYKYALTFGNYGFVGNFIVLGVWGDKIFFKYSMFTFFVSLFCYTWGLFILIPKDKASGALWKNLKKGLFTPPIIAILIGMSAGLLNLSRYVPGFLVTTLQNAGSCMGPVAMLLAGFVIGGYNFGEFFSDKKVYAATFLRLIAIPAFFVIILKALGVGEEIITLALICFATPIGLNTIVFPAAYGGDTKTGASMAMISHVMSVITIPLMYLVFIVLL